MKNEYERKLLAQQAHFARFMHSKLGDTVDPPLDDSTEAWQFRSVTAAEPDELFDVSQ